MRPECLDMCLKHLLRAKIHQATDRCDYQLAGKLADALNYLEALDRKEAEPEPSD